MTTIVKGQPLSAEVRQRLAAEGRPVLVAFSGGKDAIACTLALIEAGVDVRLAHLYLIPGREPGTTLEFVEEGLSYAEGKLGMRVHRYPHPSLYRMLNALIFQPPERCAIIEAADLPIPTYEEIWQVIRMDLGLDPDTWVADGVRAADSPYRRAALVTHGVMKPSTGKVSPIHDWVKAEWSACLDRHGWQLPPDYEMFGRSFDGIDRRFLEPMRAHRPRDYQRVLDWFPLAEMELVRHGV
ncbi:phosphoadenosine phosphosulfate reductase [Brachybacterium sp. UMB0905]|uniref:phosphoadenosine phosphosulfate reductase n=1 Tax=Brachybacterium sp. UMB0905 TaxID=2069310 RepID=UPI000C80D080|nr:phosphoadenosine phosphosulfate reductase [Brachybacterium sp. UMB0905]PMC76397.1 phosphoadenosine phosphosulfate reductase [Brachybacterium sp. UMB0905]